MISPTGYPIQTTLNFRGKLVSLQRPLVMGVLNLTPDSFSDGGRYNQPEQALAHTRAMLEAGADLIDIGGYSSRPGATDISPQEELDRIYAITAQILQEFPQAIISIDTFRASVARQMLDLGVHAINDISGGQLDPEMYATVARYPVPYFLMHMQGTPQTMQLNPTYQDVCEEVWDYFVEKINLARAAGIKDIVLDPGFGFGKTVAHNYELLARLANFQEFGLPILIGISRKSMLYKLLQTQPSEVSDLAAVLHFKALEAGARILRVHDVKTAVHTIKLFQYMQHGVI
ncbi:MAG: dihydropteroate synthase [Bacteroidia bacterium]|nr:dihydropteroate synthase [Bacteroidia bacterium]